MQQFTVIEVESQDRIGRIRLNRPDKRNALDDKMVHEIKEALIYLHNQTDTKVVVISGNGKAFCAGADLAYLQKLQGYSLEQNHQDSLQLMDLFQLIYKYPRPIVAEITGHALAGGAGLATVCDFAFSVPEAKFGYTEVRIGFVPAIVMLFLIRKVGELRARELLMSGKIIDADTAARYNMINEVVPADQIHDYVTEFAETLCTQNSLASMELTKKMIGDIQHFPTDEALKFAAKMNAHARGSDDCKRGIASFLNKEELQW